MTLTPGSGFGAQYPQYPAPTPGPGGNRDGRLPDKSMANWALGLSLLPCGISLIGALVLAIIVLTHRDDGLDHGKPRAVAALCVIGVWAAIIVVGLVVGVVGGAERDGDGRVTASGSSPILDLAVGDCLADDPETGEIYTVDVVPCTEAHAAEVFATFDLDGEWTSRREVARVAEAGCAERFRPYVGESVRRTDLDVVYYQPVDESSFDYDPGVVCVGVGATPLTGSIQGRDDDPDGNRDGDQV